MTWLGTEKQKPTTINSWLQQQGRVGCTDVTQITTQLITIYLYVATNNPVELILPHERKSCTSFQLVPKSPEQCNGHYFAVSR